MNRHLYKLYYKKKIPIYRYLCTHVLCGMLKCYYLSINYILYIYIIAEYRVWTIYMNKHYNIMYYVLHKKSIWIYQHTNCINFNKISGKLLVYPTFIIGHNSLTAKHFILTQISIVINMFIAFYCPWNKRCTLLIIVAN